MNEFPFIFNMFILSNEKNFSFQIVDIEQSAVNMLPTKVEIKLRKKEPGSWAKLDFPRQQKSLPEESGEPDSNNISAQVDAVDLSDI